MLVSSCNISAHFPTPASKRVPKVPATGTLWHIQEHRLKTTICKADSGESVWNAIPSRPLPGSTTWLLSFVQGVCGYCLLFKVCLMQRGIPV
jgi:hypothetical protein